MPTLVSAPERWRGTAARGRLGSERALLPPRLLVLLPPRGVALPPLPPEEPPPPDDLPAASEFRGLA
ncbi:MAG: hypothetical protein GEV06_14465 [Luteitalea sp.]|nr:hypothetical protein [Luteitalea sp.]